MLTDVLNVLGFDASALQTFFLSSYTGRWQCCHWAVADGSLLICRWENVQVETAARRCLDGGKRGKLIE